MKELVARYLLQPLGLAYESHAPVASPGCVASDNISAQRQAALTRCQGQSTHWVLDDINLVSGWYMLEIEHSSLSIGCILTLEYPCGHCEFLRLSSKPVCKRIVRLDNRLTRCVIHIDQPDCTLSRIRFRVLTQAFAQNRLSRRLQNRSSGHTEAGIDTATSYSTYQANLHDGLSPVSSDCLSSFDSGLQIPPRGAGEGCELGLCLIAPVLQKHQIIHSSVKNALRFARESGWRVDWHQRHETGASTNDHLLERRLFVMMILPDVEYRLDVFHQMLSVVNATTCLVYADHDHIDDNGAHHDPVLKPQWNPELLLNTDYIRLPWMIGGCQAHRMLAAYAAEGVIECGNILLNAALGTTEVTKQAALVDALPTAKELQSRVCHCSSIEALSAQQVTRIPRILASLRVSSKQDVENKVSTTNTWRRRVVHALSDAGVSAQVHSSPDNNSHRILWPLGPDIPSVDIIIPSRDKIDVLKTCVESIVSKTHYANYRFILVDNESSEMETESYYQSLLTDSRFTLLRYPGAFNYSAINNFAVRHSLADVLILLNNDTEVLSSHWLDEMVRQAMRPEIGCVGAKLYYSNGRVQHGGVILGITGITGHAHRYSLRNARGYCDRLLMTQNLSAVTAACLAVRRSVWIEVGGLDEQRLAVAWNDVDFCLKVQQAGYKNLWTPHAELFHHEGLSRGSDDTPGKIKRVNAERQTMIDRWGLNDVDDPAYHPLLTHDSESFTVSSSNSPGRS